MSAVARASAERSLQSLPTGWTWARLGDICDAINGRAFKSSEWRKSGLPIVRIQNLKNPDAEFNYFAGEFDDRHRIHHGDLLFAWSGTPGTSFGAHIWKGPAAALNQHIFNIKFDPDVLDPRYFCLALNQNVSRYVAQAQGGVGLAHITKSKFLDSFIPLAPKAKQLELVAEIEKQFSRLDEAVANLKRVQANLKRYEEATIRDATMAARRRSPICLASELFSWSSGVSLPASKQHGGAVPVYGGNGITGYHSQGNIGQATVVIGRVGAGCGNVHLVREPAWITDNAIYAARVADRISLPYAALICSAANLNSGAAGSGQPFVNQRMLNEVQVPLPSLDEQHSIVAEVDRRFSIVRSVEVEADANVKRAQALREAVLARAFGGVERGLD